MKDSIEAQVVHQELRSYALRGAPSLIEFAFPAQKVSVEAQKERKAVAGQTLTALGSYWKGRKPLIMVRALLLASMLPVTEDLEADVEIFEKLMAMDDEALARREPKLKASDVAARVTIDHPWDYFDYTFRGDNLSDFDVEFLRFPLPAEMQSALSIRWKRDIPSRDKERLLVKALKGMPYEQKVALCKRPEELDQEELYGPIWGVVNTHLAQFGIKAHSHDQLMEQLGLLRFGRRPRVGDTFAGAGSIPFEAARLGCDVLASDLNPIACMLSWGALNIVGQGAETRAEIDSELQLVAEAVDARIQSMDIEFNSRGDRAKAYLYCLETRCPETGWMIPLSPSWAISKHRNVVARLLPDHANRRFDIEIVSGVSKEEMKAAETGTVQNGQMVYELGGIVYRTPMRTIRGEYRDVDGITRNRLRQWERSDFRPAPDDIFQERLYCVQWITRESMGKARPETYFASASGEDVERERKVESIVEANLASWQADGLVPDMPIEPGSKTNEPIRTRGWRYWHHLFNPRQLLLGAELRRSISAPLALRLCQILNSNARLTRWTIGDGEGRSGGTKQVFDNQALNTLYNYGCRASVYALDAMYAKQKGKRIDRDVRVEVQCVPAAAVAEQQDLFVTDPPYADAIHYHEITEFFIAWLRTNPPPPLNEWTWDSRRSLAIQGDGEDFRRSMVEAYSAMTKHMPDNGLQCVMFTHQDTGVWGDMVSIFWAAGLRVVGAWYIATETTSELKKGGYVQGTVVLILRKRAEGDRVGFPPRIFPAVQGEVTRQIEQMMHLNEEARDKMGQPVFNDADLQMAGYAAALKVLTNFTKIGADDVTSFALRPRRKGEETVVDKIVQQAAETANSLLVPEGLGSDTWGSISGIQRFYLRMMDIETTGASKLDNYQNFAKAFRVEDYARVMASLTANKARLKQVQEFSSRDLMDSTELGGTKLGKLMSAIQQMLKDIEVAVVMEQLMDDMPDFFQARPKLEAMSRFISVKAPEEIVRQAAEVLADRIGNQRLA